MQCIYLVLENDKMRINGKNEYEMCNFLGMEKHWKMLIYVNRPFLHFENFM